MNEQQFFHYSKQILNLMNNMEQHLNGKMFHEVLPEFEENFWKAHDAKDGKAMMALHNILCKLVDDAASGESFINKRAI